MQSFSDSITPVLVLFAPLFFLVAGMLPASWANAHSKTMIRVSGVVAWLAFTSAIMAALLFSFDRSHSWNLFAIVLPGQFGSFSVGTYVNSVTIIMLLLVSFVGVIVTRYSRNYLDGEANQGRFFKWLSLTLSSILTLIVSGNLLMFSLAWIATSLCLHQLLMFYRDRRAAVLAAHKKFVASRIGDVCLLIAIYLIGSSLNTLEFEEMFRIMENFQGPLPIALHWAAILIVFAAALKSAQFPFHGWLIQVMEAPTPVSALLHAGIVNAGAFLVIRMSPIMSQSSAALGLLAIIGLMTLALASLVMLTQTSIKVSLAWSTTAQMGFMLLECGLGLYSLAMLHLVAHSLYKAHAFMASGSGVDTFRSPAITYKSTNVSIWALGISILLALLLTAGIGAAFGLTIERQPTLVAAGSIVVVAITQLLLTTASMQNGKEFVFKSAGITFMVCMAYFSLHHIFENAISSSVIPVSDAFGYLQLMLVVMTIAVFAGLLVVQRAFQTRRSRVKEILYMHLYNGLYIDVFITRVLQRVWPAPAKL